MKSQSYRSKSRSINRNDGVTSRQQPVGSQEAAGKLSVEGQLAGIRSLKELEFLKVKGGLGTGAYGQVEMAVHVATGTKLAVKKIDKRSIANKKIRATLMREVEIH